MITAITLTLTNTAQLEGLQAALELFTEVESDRKAAGDDWTRANDRALHGAIELLQSLSGDRK